jgi:ribosomal protein S12 methylthiotransferase accessory factor YcaO
MNRSGVVTLAEATPGRSAAVVVTERATIYHNGGLRSATLEDACACIDSVLKKFRHDIKFERSMVTPLDKTLSKIVARYSGTLDPQLPFFTPASWVSRGKGRTEEQAYLSAAFEMFERLSAFYHGDLEVVRATFKEASGVALDVSSFLGDVYLNGFVDHFTEDTPIDWVWGHSLVHHRPVLVPASMVFNSGNFLGHFFGPSSGGLASGAVLEDAILQALLEAIEHDAWMIWQANTVNTPGIRLEMIEDDGLRHDLRAMKECGFKVVLKNYTTDFAIPVVKAWVINEQNLAHYAFSGFGANLNPDIAVTRAITEANQYLTKPGPICSPYLPPTGWSLVDNVRSLYALFPFNRFELLPSDHDSAYSALKNMSTGTVSGDISRLISLVQNSLPDVEVAVVNLTKPEFGIPVVKTVVGGGLQRFEKPIISPCRRLFEVPVKMGYREKETPYNELYLGQFPH